MTKQKRDPHFWEIMRREALTTTTLGWELALPIFGGVLLGYTLDRQLDTGHSFTIGLLLFGIVSGYYNLVRFIQRLNAKKEREQDQDEAEKVEIEQ